MHKCRNCLCKSCMNTCGCRNCQYYDRAVKSCNSYNQFEQMSLFDLTPKSVRRPLPRFITYDNYGISKRRYKELRELCMSKKYNEDVRSAAYKANKDIAEYILLSVIKNKSYEGVEYTDGLGRIPCGRTDFYGYRRLFYHYFNEALKMVQNSSDDME